MDLSFLHQSIRAISRYKGITLINILGLAVGIGFSLLTYNVVQFELSYDSHHTKADRIYRINSVSWRGSEKNIFPATPYPLAQALREESTSVAKVSRVWFHGQAEFRLPDDPENPFLLEDQAAAVDSDFFEIFKFPIQHGNRNPLKDPGKVVISESLAEKAFGSVPVDQIIGERLLYNGTYDLIVEAIMQNPPANTDFPLHFLFSSKTLEADQEINVWPRLEFGMQTFVKLNENIAPKDFLKESDEIVEKRAGERFASFFENDMQALGALHFDSEVGGFNRTISKQTLWMFGIIGLIILITACINFINLSTAHAVTRSKEIGIKKILGNSRVSIWLRLLFETSLIVCMAFVVGCGIAYLIYPLATDILGFEPPFSIFSARMLWFIPLLLIAIILLSGIYPAIVTSAYKPLIILHQGLQDQGKSSLYLRRFLVVLQFGVSQALIICTLVVGDQLDYFITKDLGFSKGSIVNIALPQEGMAANQPFNDALKNISQIQDFSFANGAPSSGNIWMHNFTFEGAQEEERHIAHGKYADPQYLSTFNMDLLAGRNILPSDTLREVLINEMMMHEMGVTKPIDAIGKKITVGNTSLSIVGVVRDWHLVSLREPIQPSFIGMNKENFWEVNIRLNQTNQEQGIKAIEKAWKAVYPNEPFEYQFLDDQLAGFYDQELRLGLLLKILSGIAIFISCLGLIGLISFMINQKLKEIGIRKVLGASTLQIILMFSKEFTVLIIVAFIIAVPVSLHFMEDWLNSFAYRVDFKVLVFVGAMALSLFIALSMIFTHAYRASRLNPAYILKRE